MTRSYRLGLRSTALAVLALVGLPSISMAEDTVKLSPEQATNLGVRVVHPIASPTDKTLPYPAQIVIPTPQVWLVSSPVAGMLTGLRSHAATASTPINLRARASHRSNATTFKPLPRTFSPPSSST